MLFYGKCTGFTVCVTHNDISLSLYDIEQLFTEVEVAIRGYIYWTAKPWGKYSRLATDTEVTYCFSIYQNSEIIEHKNDDF